MKKNKSKAELFSEVEALRALVATLEHAATHLQKTEDANAQFAALGKRLNRVSSTEEAARIILDVASQLLGWDACTLDLYDQNTDSVTTIINIDTIAGRRLDVPPTHLGDPPTARMRLAIDRGSQLILRQEPFTPEEGSIPFGDSRPSASIMLVTIQGDTGMIGFVSIQSYAPSTYDQDDLKMLEALADYCAGAFDRILAEKKHRESAAQLRTVFENLPFAFWARDREGRCTMQNSYTLVQWGDQIGKYVDETAPTAEILRICNENNRRAFAGEVVKDEIEIKEGDLAGYYYNVIAPIRVDGEVNGILGVNIDITDRKRAEESLRESEEKFRVLAQTAASAILIYQDSKLVYVNPFAVALTGYSEQEQRSMDFWGIIHPDHREMVRQRGLARLRGETVPSRYELKLLTKSGEERWLDFSANAIEFQGKPAVLGTALDITERKQAEEALSRSQARLQHVIYCSPAIVYSLRIKGNKVIPEWVSDSITRLTGHSVSDALQEDWWVRHLHPDDRQRVVDELPRIFDNDHLVLEYRFQHKDAGYHWIHDEIRLMRNDLGKPVEVIGSWVDVTERREAEQALRASEERYRDMVENARDIIYTHDLKGNYTSVNRAVEVITGYSREEALKLNIGKVIAPEYAGTVRRMIADKLAGQKETVYDLEIIAKDRRRVTVAVNTRLVRQDGIPVGIQGIARDVTARKQAEHALRESKAHLQAILDNCPAMIFQKDIEGRYLQVNREFERTFNLSAEQVLGRTDDELFPSDLAETFKATDGTVLEAGHAFAFEETAEYEDGLHTYIVQKFPFYDPAGRVYAVGGISTDITARKRAEDELRKQKEILQKIIDHIPVMIRFRDEDGKVRLVNQEWQRTMGWTLEELQERDLDILAEAYPDPVYRREVLDFISAATGDWMDFKTKTRDGRTLDTTWASVRLSDRTFIGFGRDITEQKRAEEALLAAHARTESVLTSVADTHILFDWEWRYIYVNQAAVEAIGRPHEEILSSTLWEIYPDIVGTELDRQYRRAMNERIPLELDFHYQKTDTWWSNRFYPSPEGLAVFATDITERTRAVRELRQRTVELAALHEIELEISAESELARVLELVTRRAAESLNSTHCAVFIRDRERADLIVAASLDNDLLGVRIEEGEGLSGRVVVTGETQAIDDYSNWEGRARVLEGRQFGARLAVPLKWQHMVIGAITVARQPGEDSFTAEDANFLEQIAAESAIAIHQATLFEDLQEAHRRLQVLAHSLIDAQEAERKRLARELHDRIGQALTAVQIDLQSIQAGIIGTDRLDESLMIVDEAVKQVQDLSLELRPSLLDDLGLVAALRWYVDRVAKRARLLRYFKADSLDVRLAPEIETACFRIAQEALTNVVRHARARLVGVQLQTCGTDLQLIVKDDGDGFLPHEATAGKNPSACLGIQGMQERAVALGGLVEIISSPGQGTEVRATFPITDPVLTPARPEICLERD